MNMTGSIRALGAIAVLVLVAGTTADKGCPSPSKRPTGSLFCYYSEVEEAVNTGCSCTHVVLPAGSRAKDLGKVREGLKKYVKVLLTVHEFSEKVVRLLNETAVDGIELAPSSLSSKDDLQELVQMVKERFKSNLYVALRVPTKPEAIAKWYDFKGAIKEVDALLLSTAFMVPDGKNGTFHPSRLSGMWDMQNTDSVIDLVTGLGAPLSKIVITAPVQALHFKLADKSLTSPGSPALTAGTLTRNELCRLLQQDSKNWTLERDQDRAAPYLYSSDSDWIAFEDPVSIDIKSKYVRIRGLKGLALVDVAQDHSPGKESCPALGAAALLSATLAGMTGQARAPRRAVLRSLEREVLLAPAGYDQKVQVSQYRITRVVDVAGNMHSIRKDTRTEFECSRQGYFVHPRSCNRFYRCVKFDQLSDEFSVFEFDCPAGLAFDEKVEVCVWPGSLPHATACAGTSEIAPVPRQRFQCPHQPGYYADPENCRWFFACMDLGLESETGPMEAYEFRCPFGLVFDEARLLCEWPWAVTDTRCHSSAYLTGHQEIFYSGSDQLGRYDGLGALGTVQFHKYIPVGGVAHNGNQNALFASGNPGFKSYYQASSNGAGASGGNYISGNTGGIHGNSHYHAASINSGLSGRSSYIAGAGLGAGVGAGVGVPNHSNNQLYYTNSGDAGNYYTPNINNAISGEGAYISGQSFGQSYRATDAASNGHVINDGLYDLHQNYRSNQHYSGSNSGTNEYLQQGAGVGVTGNIGIIGGGYSAVGVQVTHNGDTASVPAVTPVPIPSISTVRAFESTPGGVIANIPDLQFKLSNASSAGYFYNQPSIPFNLEEGFKSTTVTVAPAVSYEQTERGFVGYTYSKSTPSPAPIAVSTYTSQSNGGYKYEKPLVAFEEERPKVQVFQHTTPAPVVLSTNQIQHVQPKNQGYVYQKPLVAFEEERPKVQVQYTTPATFESRSHNQIQQNQGYVYEKPLIAFEEERPKIQVLQYTTPAPLVVSTYNQVQQQSHGYVYQKPLIAFEKERPRVEVLRYTTPAPVVVSTTQDDFKSRASYNQVKQAYQQNQGYFYEKPKVRFEEIRNDYLPPEKVPSYSYQKSVKINTFQPIYQSTNPKMHPIMGMLKESPKVFTTYSYQQPAQTSILYNSPQNQPSSVYATQTTSIVSPAVTRYTYHDVALGYTTPRPSGVVSQRQGYLYPRPFTKFSEEPIRHGYTYPKPAITFKEEPVTQGYIYREPSPVQGYSYPKPSIQFNEEPRVQVISSTTPKPQVVSSYVKESPIVSTYTYSQPTLRPVHVQNQPAVVRSYYYRRPSSLERVKGYSYPKPAITFSEEPYENRQPVVEPVVVAKKAYITTAGNVGQQFGQKINSWYKLEKPAVSLVQHPIVVESYEDYNDDVQIVNTKSVTPRPSYQSTVAEVLNNKFSNEGRQFHFYDSRLQSPAPRLTVQAYSTPAPLQEEVRTSRPIAKYSFSSFDERYQPNSYIDYLPPQPSVYLPPVKSTAYLPPPKPTTYLPPPQPTTYLPPPQPTTYLPPPRPTTYLPPPKPTTYLPPPRPTTYLPPPKPTTYLPPPKPTTYLPPPKPTTYLPPSRSTAYLPPPKSTIYFPPTPSTYLPPQSSTYLPPKQVTYIPPKPSTYLPPRPRPTTYLPPKQSTYLPPKPTTYLPPPQPTTYLPPRQSSTYLPPVETPIRGRIIEQYIAPDYRGSSTVRPQPLVVVDDVAREHQSRLPQPGRTIVTIKDVHPLLTAKLGAECTCTSNTVTLKRPKQLPIQTEYDEIEQFDDDERRGAIAEDDNEESDENAERELSRAVTSLVKAAAKEGAREALREQANRVERLRAEELCQRPGLFRHPIKCNKFYSCKWDCSKKRYTLHSFNCPVHLTFDAGLGACNWPSQGPTCVHDTLLPAE